MKVFKVEFQEKKEGEPEVFIQAKTVMDAYKIALKRLKGEKLAGVSEVVFKKAVAKVSDQIMSVDVEAEPCSK